VAHQPLDVHPTLGNAVGLARDLGIRAPLAARVPFGSHDGGFAGLSCPVPPSWAGLDLEGIVELLDLGDRYPLMETYPVRAEDRNVAIVTGAGGKHVAEAAKKGIDLLITGDATHRDAILARELGVDLLVLGHHATELFGVSSLGAWMGSKDPALEFLLIRGQED